MTEKPMDAHASLEFEVAIAAEKAMDMTPPDDLMAAILRDARATQPANADVGGARGNPSYWWRWFGDIGLVFGGWPGGLTLASCLIIGLSLGYTPPDALLDFAGDVLDSAGISIDGGGYSPLEDMLVEG